MEDKVVRSPRQPRILLPLPSPFSPWARRAVAMIQQSRIRWRVILVRIFQIPGVQRSIVKTRSAPRNGRSASWRRNWQGRVRLRPN